MCKKAPTESCVCAGECACVEQMREDIMKLLVQWCTKLNLIKKGLDENPGDPVLTSLKEVYTSMRLDLLDILHGKESK